jgi:hypothetical protein
MSGALLPTAHKFTVGGGTTHISVLLRKYLLVCRWLIFYYVVVNW